MIKFISCFVIIFFCYVSLYPQNLKVVDSASNTLLVIEDQGTAGSILLQNVGSLLGPHMLYRNGDNLYWGVNQLAIAGSPDNDWTISGPNIYNSNIGNVGIRTTNPLSFLSVGADGYIGTAIYGKGLSYGGYFESLSRGVYGYASDNTGFGIYGSVSGSNSRAVYGEATNNGNNTNYGGYFIAAGSAGRGIYASASNTGMSTNYGGYFTADGATGRGIYATASNSGITTNYGGYFTAYGSSGTAVWGSTDGISGHAVDGFAYGSSGRGVFGVATGESGYGVFGYAPNTSYAGYFDGNVYVSGILSKAGGSFKIDHPLDPTNKILYHSFVESPDMKNIYDGTITLDENGSAIVNLSNWFEALNMDFRYQLTAIGAPGPNLYISEKINNNQFKIAGGAPGMEVSWQVTGIRKDAWANSNRIQVEEMKSENERGKYLHPEAYNLPKSMGVDYNEKIEEERVRSESK